MDETAKILGILVTAAKARLFDARAALRGNKALLLNHEAAGHVSRKRLSCGMGCTAPRVSFAIAFRASVLPILPRQLKMPCTWFDATMQIRRNSS
jgi:hypothetical protein